MNYKILKNSILGARFEKDKDYTIVGAGIAGLLLGFYLKKAGASFRIVEKSSRAGGLLSTHIDEFGITETAANGFLLCSEMEELCKKLDLTLKPANKSAKKRFLVRDGVCKQNPLKMTEMLKTSSKLVFSRANQFKTTKEFGHTLLGEPFTKQVMEPGFQGIYGAYLDELSFPGAMTTVAKILNQSSYLPLALIKNKRKETNKSTSLKKGTHSFEKGMQELTSKLAYHLREHIAYEADGLDIGTWENLILTTPAFVSSNFFEGSLKQLLNRVKYSPIISCTVIYKREDLNQFKDGFGCLIPRSEEMNSLGILFNNCIFENRTVDKDHLSLTAILRSDDENQIIDRMDVDIKNLVHADVNKLFDATSQPQNYYVFKWENGIPLYSPELYNNWFKMDELLKKEYQDIRLFGNYTGEISIRGMCEMAAKWVG